MILALAACLLGSPVVADTLRIHLKTEAGEPISGRTVIFYQSSPYRLIVSSVTDSSGNFTHTDNDYEGSMRCFDFVGPPGRKYRGNGQDRIPLEGGPIPNMVPHCLTLFLSENYFWEGMNAKGATVVGGRRGYLNTTAGEQARIVIDGDEGRGPVKVRVLTSQGALVWETSTNVVHRRQSTVVWPGVDRDNRKVASGIYLVHVEGAGVNEIKKIAVVR